MAETILYTEDLVRAELESIICKQLANPSYKLDLGQQFVDTGLDSVGQASIVMEAEAHFKIELDWSKIVTIGDMFVGIWSAVPKAS